MPSPKEPCPDCGAMIEKRSRRCRPCANPHRWSEESRKKLSATLSGRPKPWLRGRKRPEHSQKMKEWWTPERREEKRQEMLRRNPDARYHGLSAAKAAQIVAEAGQCNRCQGDGAESRLGVHHRDRNKRNQDPANLEVLCHRCHMQEHRHEIGWAAYHRKRKTSPS